MTVKGSRLKRLFMASSTVRSPGLWFPAIKSLNCGINSKKSCRMDRRRDSVSAGQCLQLAFSPSAAILSFYRTNKTRALQLRQCL